MQTTLYDAVEVKSFGKLNLREHQEGQMISPLLLGRRHLCPDKLQFSAVGLGGYGGLQSCKRTRTTDGNATRMD